MSEALAIVTVVGAVVAGSALVFMLNSRRFKTRKMTVAAARVIACVLVQIAAILVVCYYIVGPALENGSNHSSYETPMDEKFLLTLVVVIVDIAATVFVALYKSDWIEPIVD